MGDALKTFSFPAHSAVSKNEDIYSGCYLAVTYRAEDAAAPGISLTNIGSPRYDSATRVLSIDYTDADLPALFTIKIISTV
jgi:hypothetical protein